MDDIRYIFERTYFCELLPSYSDPLQEYINEVNNYLNGQFLADVKYPELTGYNPGRLSSPG